MFNIHYTRCKEIWIFSPCFDFNYCEHISIGIRVSTQCVRVCGWLVDTHRSVDGKARSISYYTVLCRFLF